jgi:hypothetical protein
MLRYLVFLSLGACSGFSLGENTPGGDTWTDPPPTMDGDHHVGAIAVERDEDQLWVVHEKNAGGLKRAHLAAIDPVSGVATDLLDVTMAHDRRVVFPATDRLLLMAQVSGTERLVLYDTVTRTRIRTTTKPTWYWGTRTAPSGRAVVVADNAAVNSPLHVIDLATLEHQVLPHDGEYVEAMWNHDSDVLIALSVTETPAPRAKLMRFDLEGADLSAPLPQPTVLWELDGYGWDLLFSFTWIGISPDDRWAVFPLIKHAGGEQQHVLLLLDQLSGGVTLVPGKGPVGFTHDSSRIVSYGEAVEGTAQDLWLIDPVTRARTVVPTGYPLVSFFPSRDSGHIAITSPVTNQHLTVYDTATGTLRSTNQAVGLHDFVTRPGHAQLFAESNGSVFELDLAAATATPVPLPALVGNINVRPASDQFVATDRDKAKIYRVGMATHAMQGAAIVLPSPFRTTVEKLEDDVGDATLRLPQRGRLVTRREHDGDAHSLD